MPLLQSANAAPDLEPAGEMVVSARREAGGAAAGRRPDAGSLGTGADLRGEAEVRAASSTWLLGDESIQPASPGLLRYVGWTVMARYLAPVVEAFARWRDEERWLRHYCPTCGSAPAMAQLVGVGPRPQAFSRLRPLRHTLAVQAHRLPVL